MEVQKRGMDWYRPGYSMMEDCWCRTVATMPDANIFLLETAFVSDADDVSWFKARRDDIVLSVANNLAKYAGITSGEAKYTGIVSIYHKMII